MPDSTTQMQLVASPVFLARMQYLLVQQARVVLTETGVGPDHAPRALYAVRAINQPAVEASGASVMVCGGVNLLPPATITGTPPNVDSSASDAAILSQIATFWNALSGVDDGS